MFTGKFFKKNEAETLEEDARKFKSHGQYAEAAENYARAASAYLDENQLIYASRSHEAFRMWIKANHAEEALEQARTVFHILDDTGWLKKSMEQVLDLILMIEEFKSAGFPNEANTFANELNLKLAEFGLTLKPASGTHHPSVCPSCGAQLPHPEPDEELTCSFCGYIVSAI